MNKKGQFFFFATLIILSVIFSLTSLYNFSSTTKTDESYAHIAEELKYEGVQIINNGYFNNESFDNINSNINDFTRQYSKIYPMYNISIITGYSENPDSFNCSSFSKGQIYYPANVLNLNSNQITLGLNSLEFNFNISRGFNFNVIVIEENENGRFISKA